MARSEHQQALMRIATVLLSLADAAERAGARPRPVLWLVLCFLRPAEAVARQFVVETTRSATLRLLLPDGAESSATDKPAEAFRLALTFRLLAAVLVTAAVAGAPQHRWPPARHRANGSRAETLAGPAPVFADTS